MYVSDFTLRILNYRIIDSKPELVLKRVLFIIMAYNLKEARQM